MHARCKTAINCCNLYTA